jgi:hypothetical protein
LGFTTVNFSDPDIVEVQYHGEWTGVHF